jgi:hypothetical protein
VEQFKEGWYQFFFKGLIEFSRESIRSCWFSEIWNMQMSEFPNPGENGSQ